MPLVSEYEKSKCFEVDWTSNDKNFDSGVDYIFNIIRIRGHRSNIKKHIRSFLAFSVRAYKYFPNHYIHYSRNNNAITVQAHRNPFKISITKNKEVIDALVNHGWLEHKKGIYFERIKRNSRYKLNKGFIEFINKFSLIDLDYYRVLLNDGIILKDCNGNLICNYIETDRTLMMKKLLFLYNKLISKTCISLGKEAQEDVWFDKDTSYRVFNNNSFKQGGRLYGAWWGMCKSETRKHILINGERTCEIDYASMHLRLIYQKNNQEMPINLEDDPYDICSNIDRRLVKIIFLLSINSSDFTSGHRAYVQKVHNDENLSEYKGVTKAKDYRKILDKFIEKHPVVESYLNSGSGLYLMYQDSTIAMEVLTQLRRLGIPSLSIHDSFIVQRRYREELSSAMSDSLNSNS